MTSDKRSRVALLTLHACATALQVFGAATAATVELPQPPAISSQQCRTENYRADTVFTESKDGVIAWTVTFDTSTRQLLESRTARDSFGDLAVNELDCLLHKELDEKCPRWVHDSNIAVDLDDGRLQASGLCGPETSDADT
jgi:hypothetical protein